MTSPASSGLRAARLAAFRHAFAGEIVLPGDGGYDAARRVWNGMVDRRPAMVVRPSGPDAVATAIRFAREEELEIAVRGGGHSLPGHSTSDGGVVIDLSGMRGVTVDPAKRLARANGGALLGELDAAAQEHGLVCPVGVVSHTGVGGLTLGGGMGRLMRRFGYTIDSLRRVELVTADGRRVAVSESENADLFWGLRGAGANFGIATSFEFGLHPFGGDQTKGTFVYPGSEAADVWAAYRDFVAGAPREIHAALYLMRATPGDDYPVSVAGQPIVAVTVLHAGPPSTAEGDLAPVRSFGTIVSASLARLPYLDIQRSADEDSRWGRRVYFKGGFTNDLPAAAIAGLVDHAADAGAGGTFGFWAQGGAIRDVADDATAFTGRAAAFEMSAEATWDDEADDDRSIAWVRAAYAMAEPHAATGRYVNDVMDAPGDQVRAIYGDAKDERLRALKRAWDPTTSSTSTRT